MQRCTSAIQSFELGVLSVNPGTHRFTFPFCTPALSVKYISFHPLGLSENPDC